MEQARADAVSQLTRPDSPSISSRPQKAPRKWLVLLAVPVAVGIIFCYCLKLASGLPVSSDGAANVLHLVRHSHCELSPSKQLSLLTRR